MKLDRNLNPSGKGKYALINLRKVSSDPRTPQDLADAILANPEAVEFGAVGSPEEFWPIKLKDLYAADALRAYADAIDVDPQGDDEYAFEVRELARRSGKAHPLCKRPD
jgi:hypothetical protein